MRILRWCLHGLISLILFLMLSITFLLTPLGFQTTLFTLKHLLPGQLTYQKASGLLLGPIHIQQLHYHDQDYDIDMNNLEFNWEPAQLIRKRLVITQLDGHQIRLIVPTSVQTNIQSKQPMTREALIAKFNNLKPIKPTPLHLPISIHINHATLTNISYGHDKEVPAFAASHISLNANITPTNLELEADTSIRRPQIVNIHAKLSGNLQHYQFISTIKTSQGKATLSAQGNPNTLTLHMPESALFEGLIQGNAQLHWYPQIQWQIGLTAHHLNLSHLNPAIAPNLNASIHTVGHLVEKNPQFKFNATIQSHQANIRLSLAHQTRWQANWHIHIPSLASLYNESSGSVTSDGQLNGRLLYPQTSGKIVAKKVHVGTLSADAVQANWQANLNESNTLSLQLKLKNVKQNALKLNQININLHGRYQQHTLSINTQTGKNKLQFQLNGQYDGKNWKGKITRFNSSGGIFGIWQLKQPATFHLDSASWSLQPLCLRNQRAYFCITTQRKANDPWTLNIDSQHLDFKQLQRRLRTGTQITSTLSLKAALKGTPSSIQSAHIKLDVTRGDLSYLFSDRRVNTPIRPSHFQLDLTPSDGLTTNLSLQFAKQDQISINLKSSNFDPQSDWKDSALQGNINVNAHDFRFVSLLETDLRIAPGQLAGQLSLSGTFKQPRANGSLQLNVPDFEFNMLRTHAKHIQARIDAKNNKLIYTLNATGFKDGTVTLDGYSNLDQDFDTTFAIHTKQAEIVNTNSMTITTTADVKFIFADNALTLSGQVFVPSANIRPVDLSSTLTMPTNIVTYIGLPKKQQKKQHEGRRKKINIDIKLGDDVRFNAYGINAKLEGGMAISVAQNRSTVGNGQIRIVEGTFKAYGQSLTMAKGSSISYIQSPLDNPFIDARAYRIINTNSTTIGSEFGNQTITAGVHILGTIDNMKFKLYSQPGNISQADILSYIVLGYASHNADGANLSLLLDAANSLSDSSDGLSSPLNITNSIKQKLGIEQFGVRNETQVDALGNSVGNQSAFVVGDRISKNIYIEYSHGLLVPDNIFKLQYKFRPSWMLQTSTGQGTNAGTGVDVLYTIKRD